MGLALKATQIFVLPVVFSLNAEIRNLLIQLDIGILGRADNRPYGSNKLLLD